MSKRKTTKQAKRKTTKRARKARGPLPLLPVDIAGCRLQLPLEILRDPILCPPGSEQQALLLKGLIDAHNQIHAPIIRQAEAQQTGRRKGAKQGQEKQQETALERGRKIAKIVEQHKLRKNAWQAAVNAGLAETPGAAEKAYYRYMEKSG